MQTHPELLVRAQIREGAEPFYASSLASGADLRACLADGVEFLDLQPMERLAVPTGVRLEIAPGWEAQVRSRSGLTLRNGIFCLNSPGTIDADYRGEIAVILANFSNDSFRIHSGDRIAQLVFAPVVRAVFDSADLSVSQRGAGGFGSTGFGIPRPNANGNECGPAGSESGTIARNTGASST